MDEGARVKFNIEHQIIDSNEYVRLSVNLIHHIQRDTVTGMLRCFTWIVVAIVHVHDLLRSKSKG